VSHWSLKSRKNNQFESQNNQQQIEMTVVKVSLDLRINFLEFVVIPSFAPRLCLSNEVAREAWMTERFQTSFGELSDDFLKELLVLFGTITTEEKAINKLKELEDKQERLEERAFILQQQQAGTFILFSFRDC
jgi:hypothetical protein